MQWLRSAAGRGAAGALLLLVPVVVAATIGFGNGVRGLGAGISSFPPGTSAQGASALSGTGSPVVTAGPAGGGSGAAAESGPDGAETPGEGGGGGIAPPGSGPDPIVDPGVDPEPPGPPVAGPVPAVDVPNVDVGSSNPLGGLLDSAADAVGGLVP